jgi:hypothetical protein
MTDFVKPPCDAAGNERSILSVIDIETALPDIPGRRNSRENAASENLEASSSKDGQHRNLPLPVLKTD